MPAHNAPSIGRRVGPDFSEKAPSFAGETISQPANPPRGPTPAPAGPETLAEHPDPPPYLVHPGETKGPPNAQAPTSSTADPPVPYMLGSAQPVWLRPKPLAEACAGAAWHPWQRAHTSAWLDNLVAEVLGREYLEKRVRTQDRARAIRWVENLHTRTGTRRAARIARCGELELVYHPHMRRVAWRHKWCRDRACPACAKQLSLRHQAGIRQRNALRQTGMTRKDGALAYAPAGELLGTTLTQIKRPEEREGPREATRRMLGDFRRLRRSPTWERWVIGYVRALEVVWIPAGRVYERGDGTTHRVRFSGWHAHLHMAIELAPDAPEEVTMWLRAEWLRITGGSSRGQKFHRHDEHRLGQLAKYITKPFELPDEHAERFFHDMAGVRRVAAGGTWQGCLTPEEELYAPDWCPQNLDVHQVCLAWVERRDVTMRWAEGERQLERVTKGQVLAGEPHGSETFAAIDILDQLKRDRRSLCDVVEGRAKPPAEGAAAVRRPRPRGIPPPVPP